MNRRPAYIKANGYREDYLGLTVVNHDKRRCHERRHKPRTVNASVPMPNAPNVRSVHKREAILGENK